MFRPVPLVITGTADADMNIFKAHLPHIEPWYCRKGFQAQMLQLGIAQQPLTQYQPIQTLVVQPAERHSLSLTIGTAMEFQIGTT